MLAWRHRLDLLPPRRHFGSQWTKKKPSKHLPNDEKLGPISELLIKHSNTLDNHEERLAETKQRISALEDTTCPVEAKIKALEEMADKLNKSG